MLTLQSSSNKMFCLTKTMSPTIKVTTRVTHSHRFWPVVPLCLVGLSLDTGKKRYLQWSWKWITYLAILPEILDNADIAKHKTRTAKFSFFSDPSPIIVYPCNSLTDSCLVNLIDVTLMCEDTNSKLVEVVAVADAEDHAGNSFLIGELTFGHKAKLLFRLWAQGLVKI